MKKLKISSPFNITIIILFIISIIHVSININKPIKSFYNNKYYKSITGTIIKCNKQDDYYQITLKAKENIIFNDYHKTACKIGKKVKIQGIMQSPPKNTIFHLFNYKYYLYSNKIYHQIKIDKITLLNNKIKTIYKIKNHLKKHIDTYKSREYLNAFILGNTKEINDKIISSYRINGISHLLAISGMHITLISVILLFVLNHLSKLKKINYIIVILILIFYAFITNFTPSVVRAVSLFITITIKKEFKLKIETIYLLILICSIYLLYNPYLVYNIGFLFSFTITFFLILYNELLTKSTKYINKIFITSLIAFLVSIPILINSFFEINLLSPIINIIFIPLISFIIYPLSLLSLIIKPIDNILILIINYLEQLSLLIIQIPFFKITLKYIPPIYITIYYLLIMYIINKLNIKRIILLLIILFIHHNINLFMPNTSITMLDVGQGDSTLISFPHNQGNILIDTGGQINFNHKPYQIVLNKTIPFLKSFGINHLDYLILTHGDADHMGEAINLVNNFKVEKVIFNCGEFNELEQELIKVLDKKKIPYYSCIKELNIDNNKLYFLQTKEYDNENDNSNVIYTELDGYKFMFMGDAGIEKEKDILNKYNISDIGILKVGHHGSKTSSSYEFIDKINPKYSVISVGKNNRYGHPNKEVLNALENSKIYRTDQDGSIMFKIKNNKLKIETCSP